MIPYRANALPRCRRFVGWLGAAIVLALGWTPLAWAELKIDEEKVLVEGPTLARPRLAYGDGIYLVVWQEGWTGVKATADIKGLRLKAGTLEPLDPQPIPICTAAEAQEDPAVAWADGLFLVVWQDFRTGTDLDVRGLLIDGRTGEPRGREIDLAVGPDNQCRPALAAHGDTFLVVWQEARSRDRYGIRGVRISRSGRPLDGEPLALSDAGASPAVGASAGKFLVTWSLRAGNRGSTAAALLESRGHTPRNLGVINSCCSDGTVVAADAAGNFLVVAAREPYPNPWGWPGPGAVLASRVLADGSTPEAKLNYGYRLSHLCSRSVPNVVDTATWAKSKTWDAGAPGGFPGTADGLWPNGWPAAAPDRQGGFLVAWVKGTIARDRLNLDNRDIWLRGMDGQSLEVRLADRKAAARPDSDETRPVLSAGPAGEFLLVYERLQGGAPRRLAARRLRHEP